MSANLCEIALVKIGIGDGNTQYVPTYFNNTVYNKYHKVVLKIELKKWLQP